MPFGTTTCTIGHGLKAPTTSQNRTEAVILEDDGPSTKWCQTLPECCPTRGPPADFKAKYI